MKDTANPARLHLAVACPQGTLRPRAVPRYCFASIPFDSLRETSSSARAQASASREKAQQLLLPAGVPASFCLTPLSPAHRKVPEPFPALLAGVWAPGLRAKPFCSSSSSSSAPSSFPADKLPSARESRSSLKGAPFKHAVQTHPTRDASPSSSTPRT